MGYFDEMQGVQQADVSGFVQRLQQMMAMQQQPDAIMPMPQQFQQQQMAPQQQEQQAIPGLPDKIVSAFSGEEKPQGGSAQDILSARFNKGPEFQDYLAQINSAVTDKPVMAQQNLMSRLKDMSEVQKNETYIRNGGGSTPAALQMANEVMRLEAIGTPEALAQAQRIREFAKTADVQTMYGKGLIKNPDGTFSVAEGYAPAMGKIKYNEKLGEQNAVLGTAADIERQKKIGSGEITDIEKRDTGQNRLSSIINDMRANYNKLDAMNAITSEKRTPEENLKISAFNTSNMAQALRGRAAAPDQVVRQTIKNQIPRLMTSIKSATGMSAQEVNSIPEMQLLKDSVTNPKQPIETVMETLNSLERDYGGGTKPSAPSSGGKIRVQSPSGEVGYIDQSEIGDAVANGWKQL